MTMRNRKKKNSSSKDKKKDSTARNVGVGGTKLAQNADPETLWQTFYRHPVVRITVGVVVPYAIYIAYLYVRLQKPELLSLWSLRPAVGVPDARQLLIMGSMSSGTTQVAAELSRLLDLEVGHEQADTAWNFVRDGTVSHFHITRYLPLENTTASLLTRVNLAVQLCGDTNTSAAHYKSLENMGFHPFMYQASTCSYRQRGMGDNCWRKECYAAVLREYGCAVRDDCVTPFARSLHQVRNPLRVLESLVVKFCTHVEAAYPVESFRILANATFPEHDFYQYNGTSSYIEALGWYVVLYNQILVKATSAGLIDGVYRVEDVTVCEIADLAGLLDSSTTVYGPNHDRVAAICHGPTPPGVLDQSQNMVNQDRVRLGWGDIRAISSKLEKSLRKLFATLGYDASLESKASLLPSPVSGDDSDVEF
jgi:hypothetical protein